MTSGHDGSVTTLDLGTRDLSHRSIAWFAPPDAPFSSYDFSPDDELLHVSPHTEAPEVVRDVETGAVLFDGTSWGFTWSPDGAFAVLLSGVASVVVMDRDGRQVASFAADGFTTEEDGVSAGPGSLVAIRGGDDRVRIWDWDRDLIVSEFVPPNACGTGAIAPTAWWRADGSGEDAIGGPDALLHGHAPTCAFHA